MISSCMVVCDVYRLEEWKDVQKFAEEEKDKADVEAELIDNLLELVNIMENRIHEAHNEKKRQHTAENNSAMVADEEQLRNDQQDLGDALEDVDYQLRNRLLFPSPRLSAIINDVNAYYEV